MLNLTKKAVATLAGVALVVIGLPTQAMAVTNMPTGDENSVVQALKLEKLVHDNDTIVGPKLNSDDACAFVALSAQERTQYFTTLNALRQFNHLDPVADISNAETDKAYQEGAISMAASGAISHGLKPADEFKCRTSGGVDSTNAANLSSEGATYDGFVPAHLRGLVVDEGNDVVGHRIAMFNTNLKNSTVAAANSVVDGWNFYTLSMMVANGATPYGDDAHGASGTNPDIIAWPSAGAFPYSLLPKNSDGTIGQWSLTVPGVTDWTGVSIKIYDPYSTPRAVPTEKIKRVATNPNINDGAQTIVFDPNDALRGLLNKAPEKTPWTNIWWK